uniref:SFRICE_040686 n=1 Tax=Spodoptera frugiperda TaxID=7108 RepID=A0A2H1X066_SPOFR
MPIGKLEPFNLSSKQWPAYIRRVNQYILLNDVKDNLKVPMLITVVGEPTYSLMCDLCSPGFPENKSYEELVKLVADHLEPQRSEIAERHVFRLRRQRDGESMMEYLQDLKHLATTCNFGIMLEENLRDQFVSGLANSAMRSRIFAEKNIKYKEAVELALALEAAERHAEVSAATTAAVTTSGAGGDAGEGLHRTGTGRLHTSGAGTRRPGRNPGPRADGAASRGGTPAETPQCWRCGKSHRPERCRYINYNCDEYASNELGTEAGGGEPMSAARSRLNSPPPPPPPPGASARTIRAHVRAVNKDKM